MFSSFIGEHFLYSFLMGPGLINFWLYINLVVIGNLLLILRFSNFGLSGDNL